MIRSLKDVVSMWYPSLLAMMLFVVRRYRGLVKPRLGSVVICPTSTPGSFGDEAMLAGCLDYYLGKHYSQLGLVTIDDGPRWTQFDFVRDHKGVVSIKYLPLKYLLFLLAIVRYEKFCVLGADTMDGHYASGWSLQKIHLAEIANRAGLESAIVGFSFNENPSSQVLSALNGLTPEVRLCARDPVSWKRLCKLISRPIDLVADLAFLLRPDGETEMARSVESWVGQQNKNDRIVIGINANYEGYRSLKGEADKKRVGDLVSIYAKTLSKLGMSNTKVSFLFIPHDVRDTSFNSGDVKLAEAIFVKLPKELQDRSMIVPMPCSAAEIKYICGMLNVVLSGRMHLAIASLGMGIPAACVTYQGKFEGLYEHFGLSGMAITPNEAFVQKELGEFLVSIIERELEIRKHIVARLPEVRALSLMNFEGLD